MRDRDVSIRWLWLLLPIVFVLGIVLAAQAEKSWRVVPVADPPAPLPAPPPVDEDRSAEQKSWDSGDLPLRLEEGMGRPVPISRPQPRATEMSIRAGVRGTVILEVIIDRGGRITDVHVLKGLPLGLDREAVDAVRTWRFQPATLNGKPVKVYYTVTVTFSGKR